MWRFVKHKPTTGWHLDLYVSSNTLWLTLLSKPWLFFAIRRIGLILPKHAIRATCALTCCAAILWHGGGHCSTCLFTVKTSNLLESKSVVLVGGVYVCVQAPLTFYPLICTSAVQSFVSHWPIVAHKSLPNIWSEALVKIIVEVDLLACSEQKWALHSACPLSYLFFWLLGGRFAFEYQSVSDNKKSFVFFILIGFCVLNAN